MRVNFTFFTLTNQFFHVEIHLKFIFFPFEIHFFLLKFMLNSFFYLQIHLKILTNIVQIHMKFIFFRKLSRTNGCEQDN